MIFIAKPFGFSGIIFAQGLLCCKSNGFWTSKGPKWFSLQNHHVFLELCLPGVFCVVKAMDFNTVDMKPRACLGRIQFFSLCDLSLHSCMRFNLFVIRFLIRASDYIWQLCFPFFNVAGACCDLTKTHGFLFWHGRPVHKKSWRCPSRVLWLTCPWSLRNNGKHHEYCDRCSPSVQFCDMCSKRFWDNPFTRPCFSIRISRKLFQLDLSVIPEESPSNLNADQNTLVFIFYQSDGSSPVVMAQTHHRRNPPFQDPRLLFRIESDRCRGRECSRKHEEPTFVFTRMPVHSVHIIAARCNGHCIFIAWFLFGFGRVLQEREQRRRSTLGCNPWDVLTTLAS